ncbi:replication initiator protein [Apis mellifera associated microvirus 6]|nr:replication initiator protein [Apis mellifera associated microvirus 6]
MPCYFPLQAKFSLRKDGKKDIKFSATNARLFSKGLSFHGDNNLSLPCGNCMGCRLERSRQWAVRCLHESKCFEDNCFVTLTYADEFLPEGGTLVRKDIQDFVKRLRMYFSDRKIRVFYCGEYGDKMARPHYHLILFNLDFPDKEKLFKIQDNWVYGSKILQSLWKFGHSSIGAFSFESAAYVARYCTKKINGSLAKDHYNGRVPEFAGMSLKPGIGASWFEKFGRSDLFPHDNLVVRGAKCKPPRYYDILRERVDPDGFAKAKLARKELGESMAHDSTFKRLATRLKCFEAKTKVLVRKLEKGFYG